MSLPKKKRLGKDFFKEKAREKTTKKGRYFNLETLLSPKEGGINKYAVVVPSKKVKKATKRNKIKRIIKSEIREWDKENKTEGDFIFYFKADDENIEKKELVKDIKSLLKKV